MTRESRTELRIAQPRWGIRFARPSLTNGGLPLIRLAVPPRLIVALQQHIGSPAHPVVAPGDPVLRGQPIAMMPPATLGATIHAPTSGVVTAIETHMVPGRGAAPCVHIEADGNDEPWAGYAPVADPLSLSSTELRAAVAAAGIVGLGGATFPSAMKLNRGSGVDLLIINGVECEPRISCDDALMRERADDVVLGARIMLRMLAATTCIVAIKADAESALTAMRAAIDTCGDDRLRLALIPAVYPAGGEAQLVQLLTGKEIPAGGLPADLRIVCNNVATAAAIAQFLHTGVPLISRIVTVTGSGVAQPRNIEARIGTPVSALIDAAGGYTSERIRLVMGGPMMGVPLATDALPVTKACNCIYVEPATAMQKQELPCIRCGDCATVCPVELTPQLLLQAQRNNDLDKLQQLGLGECIECGCCDYVCPSHIPLTAKFVTAKQAQWTLHFEQRRARLAETRYRAREERLYQQAQQREQELAAQTSEIGNNPAAGKAALQALLDRVAGRPRDGEP